MQIKQSVSNLDVVINMTFENKGFREGLSPGLAEREAASAR